jgi:hypothetical protein
MIAKLPKGIRMIKQLSIQNYNTLTTQAMIQMLQAKKGQQTTKHKTK